MSDTPGAAAHPATRLIPPPNGVTVRMYRIGHGDCFLLAFPGVSRDAPVYVLIDCGYKPGSPKFISTTAKQVCASIREATGGHIHVAVITHEHQDHVNAITATNFADVTIGETWVAWTEDPEDDLANQLRTRFKDRLALLMEARNHLAADAGSATKVVHIDDFLAFELGGEEEAFDHDTARALLAADDGAEPSLNKRAMKLFKTKAANGVRFLRPHDNAVALPGSAVRIFPLGPPRDVDLLHSLNPEGDELFPDAGRPNAFGAAPATRYLAAAIAALASDDKPEPPFSPRYRLRWEDAFGAAADGFWTDYYGDDAAASAASRSRICWRAPSCTRSGTTAAITRRCTATARATTPISTGWPRTAQRRASSRR